MPINTITADPWAQILLKPHIPLFVISLKIFVFQKISIKKPKLRHSSLHFLAKEIIKIKLLLDK